MKKSAFPSTVPNYVSFIGFESIPVTVIFEIVCSGLLWNRILVCLPSLINSSFASLIQMFFWAEAPTRIVGGTVNTSGAKLGPCGTPASYLF